MSRVPRQYSKSGFYHVMMRGVNRERIFEKADAKREMLNILSDNVAGSVGIYAYCIMDNHIHLLLRAEPEDLVAFMKKVNGSFAAYYNREENRIGPVFQGRYRSECIEDERYFWGALRYIHRNPVQAYIVKSPQEYEWSSLKEYLTNKPKLLDEKALQLKEDKFHDNESFLKMHEEEDLSIYIDVNEELAEMKSSAARKLIQKTLAESGVTSAQELRQRGDVLQNLLYKLAVELKLTYKEIAVLTNLSYSMVQRLLSKM